ncbi:MAG: DUF962 domain-containing protein [Rhizomicrobium sp.]|jgi:hypothetical protein
MSERIQTYREFWPYYLREHARPETRRIHFIGTGLSTLALIAATVTGNLWFVPVALVAGYGPAWIGHFFIEKNRPATFRYPLWSLVSDYRMAFVWLAGGLSRELEKAGVTANG